MSVNVTIGDEHMPSLERMMTALGYDTVHDTVNEALTILELLVEEKQKGLTVAVVSAADKQFKVVNSHGLDRVTKI